MVRGGDSGELSREFLPGGALRLIPSGVALLAPEEAVWEAMLVGWTDQQLARGLKVTTMESRVRLLRRFQEFAGIYPWSWSAADVDAFVVQLRTQARGGRGGACATLRGYQGTIALFCSYLISPAYGWTEVCLERFGDHPVQICSEWNTIRHVVEFEADPRVRPFTKGELQRFFDYADDMVERGARTRRKGWLSAYRDSTMFKFFYSFGLRHTEGLRVDVCDFHPSPAAPEFGDLGSCSVRYGKSAKGGPPKRRTVLMTFPWTVPVLTEYLEEVRPRYAPEGLMLFPTERGGRVSGSYLNARFGEYRDAAGLPAELHPHCLRHSYVTHLIEDGWDPFFVQQQVGHSYSSTTAIYTGVSTDYKNTMLRKALDRSLGADLTLN